MDERLERIEDAILELALSTEDGDVNGVYARVGECLFGADAVE